MVERKKYWLMKTEPEVFGIHHLQEVVSEPWDGVRNYQARNYMRDDMRVGDSVLLYHSSTKPVGVAGVARVCREAYPDYTAWDKDSAYYDPKSDPENPRWYMVDVEFVEKFPTFVSLKTLKGTPGLDDMMVIRRGMRLSIQPVTAAEFRVVVKLGRRANLQT